MVPLIAFPVLMIAYGACVSRWHGGGFVKAAKVLKNAAWAVPFGVLLYPHVGLLLALLAAAGGFLKGVGHGGGIDLGTNPKEPGAGRDIEKLEYLIYWLYRFMPRAAYDALLLSITGLAAVLGSVIALALVDPVAAIIQAIGGLAKATAYALGWAIFPEPADSRNTETGEFLTGAFAYAGLIGAIYYVSYLTA